MKDLCGNFIVKFIFLSSDKTRRFFKLLMAGEILPSIPLPDSVNRPSASPDIINGSLPEK